MNYSQINKALAKEFGKGKVEVRPNRTQEWEYVLWFAEDHPSKKAIRKATEIVNQFQPTEWLHDKAFHSAE